MMRQKKLKEFALLFSEGLLASVTNVLLFQFFLMGASFGKPKTSRGAYAMLEEATRDFKAVNFQTIKQTFAYLKRKGLIRSLLEPTITVEGKKRLLAKIPQYQEKRTWDKVIYLITYDIPESKRRQRNKLRDLLITVGAGGLQNSVWLTPYNPQKILQEFSGKTGFEGEIIVSCVGKDGYIGNEDIKTLIAKVYKLDEVNKLYLEFLKKIKKPLRRKKDKWNAVVQYLSILKRDPQLPFELLPRDWAGEEAQKIYSAMVKFDKNS